MTDAQQVAEAIYKACHSEWRGYIPRSIELKYQRMAQAAITTVKQQIIGHINDT